MRPLLISILLFSTTALASPPGPVEAKKVAQPAPKPAKPKPETVDPLDDARLKNALLESQLARATWETIALQLALKYHMNPATDSWDPQTLVITRKEQKK